MPPLRPTPQSSEVCTSSDSFESLLSSIPWDILERPSRDLPATTYACPYARLGSALLTQFTTVLDNAFSWFTIGCPHVPHVRQRSHSSSY